MTQTISEDVFGSTVFNLGRCHGQLDFLQFEIFYLSPKKREQIF